MQRIGWLWLVVSGCTFGWAAPSTGEEPATEPPPRASTEASTPSVDPTRRLDDPDAGLAVGGWTTVAEGIELGLFESDVDHPVGDGRIRVVRVDPTVRKVAVPSAITSDASWKGADAWAISEDLRVAINPSMFHPHGESVFALHTPAGRHPTAWKKGASAALVAEADGSAARVVDTSCTGTEGVLEAPILVQDWRLVGCDGKAVWKRNGKIWSHAVIGADRDGRLLFIHARTPWNTAVFTDILRGLPLELKTLMYAEGGPEASLVVRGDDGLRVWVGSYETGFTEHDRNRQTWNLPTVLGVR